MSTDQLANDCSPNFPRFEGLSVSGVLPEAQHIGEDVKIQSCCGKWDECQAGDLYVAIVGADEDGHDFALEAVKRGAIAIVTERLLAVRCPQFIVHDSRLAYGQVSHALAGNPSKQIATIAVSGTDGKTVTAHLIDSILQVSGHETGMSTSIENRLSKFSSSLDKADRQVEIPENAPTLAQQLADMVTGKCTHAIVEMASIPLAQRAMAGTQLDIAVLTNVRKRFLEYHGSASNYRRANHRLIQQLKPTGVAILNADDPNSRQLIDELDVPTLTIGMHESAEVTAKLIDRNCSFQTFIIRAGSETIPVQTRIIGKQHVYNCLAAAAVGLVLGHSLEVIAKGLERAEIPGRLERVDCGQDYGVWVDSAKSPNQLLAALGAVGRVTEGKLWCICSTDESQTAEDRKQLGAILERTTEQAIITRAKIDKNIDYEPAHQVLDGFSDSSKPMVIPDRIKALEFALANASPGDSVLIAGCGEKPIAVLSGAARATGEKNWHVSDRDVCKAWLYDANTPETPGSGPITFRLDDYR